MVYNLLEGVFVNMMKDGTKSLLGEHVSLTSCTEMINEFELLSCFWTLDFVSVKILVTGLRELELF